MKVGAKSKFELEEIEAALVSWARGEPPSYHRLGYAWNVLRTIGHKTKPENDVLIEEIRKKLSSRPL